MSNIDFDPRHIKNILFDLGGVLLNIDYNLTEMAFVNLGLRDFQNHYSQAKQDGLFDSFERGLIPKNQFISVLSRQLENVSDEDIIVAWNSMLLDFPSNRLSMLKELQKKYGIYLLSNTNEIHFNAFNVIFSSAYDDSFSSYFKKDYYSHLIQMRKPDAEVFEYIMKEESMLARELLFIDDSEQHVEAAKQLGIHALLLKKDEEVIDVLRELNILT